MKKSTNRPSLQRAQIATKILQEELDNGLQILDRMQKQKQYLAKRVVEELEAQKAIREKILRVKKEIKLLKMTTAANQNILDKTRRERMVLDAELTQVESMIHEYKNFTSQTIQNNFAQLIEAVNRTGEEFQAQKSVVLTCARDLIQTTEQNEFEDFIWRAKIATNQKRFGMRIRFEKLTLSAKDLKDVYLPTIAGIAQKFARNNVEIKTRTKKDNGMVVALDIIITAPLRARVKPSVHPEV